jgi:hypothetical protein
MGLDLIQIPKHLPEAKPTMPCRSRLGARAALVHQIRRNAMKKTLAALTALLTVCLAASPAMAAGAPKATLSADGRTTYIAPGAHTTANSAALSHDGLTVLANTFSTDPNNLYDCCSGWTVSSRGSIVQAKQAIGMAFTPAADTNLRKVVVAVGWVTGLNHVTMSLQTDAGGLPGDSIKRGQEDNLNVFGDCCSVTAIPSKPIPLMGGVQYWIVARATSDTWAAWNVNNIGATGNFAFNSGGGWQLTNSTLAAFAVYGD